MDTAVALVQAYLRVNGYFTVAEYPVMESAGGGHRSLTDLDILAFGSRAPGGSSPKRVDRPTGQVTTEGGHRIRMVVFGSTLDEEERASGFSFIPLGHVVGYLEEHLRQHWDLVRHAQTKEPTLGFLMTLEKARRGIEGAPAGMNANPLEAR